MKAIQGRNVVGSVKVSQPKKASQMSKKKTRRDHQLRQHE
jgi:hypothetical protein